MNHYLIVYSHRSGTAEVREFSDARRADAIRARFDAELTASTDLEVVVVSARSRHELAHTHSRYFSSVSEIARNGANRTFDQTGPGTYRLGRAALA